MAARPQPRLKPINRQQSVLRPVDVEQLVEADHPVRAIWELMGRLLPESFWAGIKAVEGIAGQAAFDPGMDVFPFDRRRQTVLLKVSPNLAQAR